MKANYTILAIETSLDDTCAAITVDDRVISNVVASQTAFHEEFGGTVPHIAKRKHVEWLRPTIRQAQGKLLSKEIDSIAVTYGPGLAPCLEVGIETAVALAKEWKKPLIAVNHMEGHLLACLAKNSRNNTSLPMWGLPSHRECIFPALGFIISGGHTELVLVKAIGDYQLLGETLDDAAGEAYDKVARMLKLGYPGGPILAELAKKGNGERFPFPEPMRGRKDLDFSFSGIKTAAMNKLKELGSDLDKEATMDFAAGFQVAVLKMLKRRLERAIEQYQPKSVILGGGVVSNTVLRNEARKAARKYGLKVLIPYSKKMFTDNAAMIGVTAWYKARRGEFVENLETLDREPNLNFKREAGV